MMSSTSEHPLLAEVYDRIPVRQNRPGAVFYTRLAEETDGRVLDSVAAQVAFPYPLPKLERSSLVSRHRGTCLESVVRFWEVSLGTHVTKWSWFKAECKALI